MDLVEILRLRVEKALDGSKVEEGAVRKTAAFASRETGDAQKAVELLAKAVKLAEEGSGRLREAEVNAAERSLELDKTEELIRSLARQQQLALQACYLGFAQRRGRLSTGDAFQVYADLCKAQGTTAISQRRFSDMLNSLDLYGLVNATVISKGRFGKTREMSPSLPAEVASRLLKAE